MAIKNGIPSRIPFKLQKGCGAGLFKRTGALVSHRRTLLARASSIVTLSSAFRELSTALRNYETRQETRDRIACISGGYLEDRGKLFQIRREIFRTSRGSFYEPHREHNNVYDPNKLRAILRPDKDFTESETSKRDRLACELFTTYLSALQSLA